MGSEQTRAGGLMASFCETKTTPYKGVARAGRDVEAVIDLFVTEDFEGLLERLGAGAGEAEAQDLKGSGACPLGLWYRWMMR
jgi:hypothetical protein